MDVSGLGTTQRGRQWGKIGYGENNQKYVDGYDKWIWGQKIMWWKIDTCGHRGSGIKKEAQILFNIATGRRLGIMDTTSVNIRSQKMAKNPIGGRKETLIASIGL